MGEVESKTSAGITAEQRLAYLERVCRLIETSRDKFAERSYAKRTVIEHHAKGGYGEHYSWALDCKLLEEKPFEDESKTSRCFVTFTEQARLLLYLASITREYRKISSFEREFIRKSTLDFNLTLSKLPDAIKEDLEALYRSAVEKEFIQEPGKDHANGDGTSTCRPTERLQAYLKELFSQYHPQNPQPQATLENPEENQGEYAPQVSAFRKQDSGTFMRRVHDRAKEDPLMQKLAEKIKGKKSAAQPTPDESAPAEGVVDLGLRDVIDDDKRAKRMRALAKEQAKQNKGLLGKFRDMLGS